MILFLHKKLVCKTMENLPSPWNLKISIILYSKKKFVQSLTVAQTLKYVYDKINC